MSIATWQRTDQISNSGPNSATCLIRKQERDRAFGVALEEGDTPSPGPHAQNVLAWQNDLAPMESVIPERSMSDGSP